MKAFARMARMFNTDKFEQVLLQPWIGAVGTVSTVLAGSLASFFTNDIKEHYWPVIFVGNFSFNATLFWVLIVLIGMIIHGTQWAQNRASARARKQLDSQVGTLNLTVRRLESLPPEDFLTVYQELVRRATAVTIAVTSTKTLQDIEQGIRNVLGAILEVTQKYDGTNDGTEYHANIMMFRPLNATESACPAFLPNCREKNHPDYEGCLELVVPLSTTTNKEGFEADSSLEPVALLIPTDTTPTRNKDLAEKHPMLPGAPWSFVKKEFAGFTAITELSEWLEAQGSMDEKTKHDVRFYFSEGQGKDISSFVSMPLLGLADAADDVPLGVLNLHSNHVGIAGVKGAERLSPLLEPFRQLLSILVIVRDSIRVNSVVSEDSK